MMRRHDFLHRRLTPFLLIPIFHFLFLMKQDTGLSNLDVSLVFCQYQATHSPFTSGCNKINLKSPKSIELKRITAFYPGILKSGFQ